MVICAIITMSGCAPDLGNIKSDEEYVDAFGSIYLYSENSETHAIESVEFDFEDFYNADLNNSSKIFAPDGMEAKEYSYLVLEIEDEIKIEELYLFFQGDTGNNGSLNVSVTLLTTIPDFSETRKYDDPKKKTIEVEEDGVKHTEEVEYPDPMENKISTSNVSISRTWDSIGYVFYNSFKPITETNKPVHCPENSYLVFRFNNNTAYGKDVEMTKLSFLTTGFFIRAMKDYD